MLNSIRKKISLAFIGIALASMLSMLAIALYEDGQMIAEQGAADGKVFAAQLSRSLSGFDLNTPSAIQKYLDESDKEESTITNMQFIDTTGKIIANTDSAKVGIPADSKALDTLKSGQIIDIPGTRGEYTVIVPYRKDNKIEGAISLSIQSIDLMNTIVSALQRISLLVLIVLVLVLILAYFISGKIAKPIKSAVGALDQISKGDFTVNLKVESNDELGMLAKAMNETMAVLREMIGNVVNTTIHLDDASQALSSSSEEVASSSMEVAKAVEEVAEGASKQSFDLSESVNLLENFAKTLDSINENVENVSDASGKIKNSADLGSLKIEELVKSVADIRQAFAYVIDKLSALNSSVEKITAITEVINNVAGQTNLLALNAAIEAARAGEVGKGFAVVADEIRKLAEQVSHSSKGIMTLVSTVTAETKDVSSTADSVSGQMEEQVETVANTVASFKDILNQVQLIVPQIKNVNTSLELAVKAKENVVSKVQAVASVSEEVSASAEEISASTEEQTAAAQELTATVQSLASMSRSLHSSITKFKI